MVLISTISTQKMRYCKLRNFFFLAYYKLFSKFTNFFKAKCLCEIKFFPQFVKKKKISEMLKTEKNLEDFCDPGIPEKLFLKFSVSREVKNAEKRKTVVFCM